MDQDLDRVLGVQEIQRLIDPPLIAVFSAAGHSESHDEVTVIWQPRMTSSGGVW